jgi:hypothetical protein
MNLKAMAAKADTERSGHIGTAILEQLVAIDQRKLSPATARELLEFSFDRSHQERVHVLSGKARGGTLTPAEDQELEEYIHVGDLLAILQAKARQVLKHADIQR